MKSLLLAALLALPSFAATIITDPIPVSGHENFSYDSLSGSYTVTLSGSGSGHSIGVFYSAGDCCLNATTPLPSGSTFGGHGNGNASIDQIVSAWFVFGVGDGGGHLSLYDDSRFDNIVAQASLVGYSQITSFMVETGPSPLRTGAITITPTQPLPEPATVALSLTGLSFLWLNRKRNRIAR